MLEIIIFNNLGETTFRIIEKFNPEITLLHQTLKAIYITFMEQNCMNLFHTLDEYDYHIASIPPTQSSIKPMLYTTTELIDEYSPAIAEEILLEQF